MKITSYTFDITREPLARPFEFKGGRFTEKWHTRTTLLSSGGANAAGIGGLAILWSDPQVFSEHTETGGNLLMAAVAENAAARCMGKEYDSPIEAIESLFGPAHEYGKNVTSNPHLRKTFTLNSLVSLDLALWKIYAAEKSIDSFDALIPAELKTAFTAKQTILGRIPLITYNVPPAEIRTLAETGHFLLKIKIGQSGSQKEMLDKDRARLVEVFDATKDLESRYTDSGKIEYYLDANGRYESKERVMELCSFAESIHMLDRIAILEEPFPEKQKLDVTELPTRVSADESLHSPEDVHDRIDLGYGAIALKPAGKGLSLSLLMGAAAYERQIPCYVADSTCIPELVEWNKNLAARLPSLPGFRSGFFESNGAQFYKNWRTLIENHPCHGAAWFEARDGAYSLDDDYYDTSGGVFL